MRIPFFRSFCKCPTIIFLRGEKYWAENRARREVPKKLEFQTNERDKGL
jgi:hypothetical protein